MAIMVEMATQPHRSLGTHVNTTFGGTLQVIKWESTGVGKPENIGWVNVIENIQRHVLGGENY